MFQIYQNRYGERENRKGKKYSISAHMRFLHGAKVDREYSYKPYFDFKKAFEKVPHHKVVSALAANGITGS